MTPQDPGQATHEALIRDQFTRQAEGFAKAPELHDQDALKLLVDCAAPRSTDAALDIACGPGSVVAALAARVRHAIGLDATEAMLEQARALAAERGLGNVEWRLGDVYALPFGDGHFDIVSCRFAFHHLERPGQALAEMVRVCRPGGRIVVCDGIASDDPVKAATFNRMERLRDPSTVEFRTLGFLRGLFAEAGLPAPSEQFFQVATEMEHMIAISFPENDDRDSLRRILADSVAGDTLGMNARRDGDTVWLAYQAVILAAAKPAAAYG